MTLRRIGRYCILEHMAKTRLIIAAVCCAILIGTAFAGEQESRDLTLSEAVGAALKSNLTLEEKTIMLRKSEAVLKSSKGEFDPSVKFDLKRSYDKKETNSTIPPYMTEDSGYGYGMSVGGKALTGTQYELKYWTGKGERSEPSYLKTNPYYTSELKLTLTQPLLKGFGLDVQRSNVLGAVKGVEIARLDAEWRAMQVISDTVDAYWDLYLARHGQDAAELSLKLAENILEEVKTKISAGTLAPVEIYKAEAEAAVRSEKLLASRKAVSDAEDKLRAIMNTDEWHYVILPAENPVSSDAAFNIDDLIASALQNRKDYLQALADFEKNEIQSNYEHSQSLPDLNLSGSYSLNGLNGSSGGAYDEARSGQYYSWQVGMSLSVPLGNRIAEGKYQSAKRELEASKVRLEQVRKAIIVEVREAYRMFSLSAQTIKAAERTKIASEKRLKAEEERFRLGMAVLNDVLRYQDEYANSLVSEKKAQTDYAKSLVKIKKTAGILAASDFGADFKQ